MDFNQPQSAMFVGREEELKYLETLVHNDSCQLITITGAGGSGKTRLVLELQQSLKSIFDNGQYFVPLKPHSVDDDLSAIIAEDVGLPNQSSGKLSEIFNYFNDKNMLLILDNFEHLLTQQNIKIITEVLASAPDIKIIITSRETLNIREECILRLDGMRYPEQVTDTNPQDYDAIQLFVRHASRQNPKFTLEEELECVVRICQQVDGLPLAIELAASWLRYMPCEQIANDITRNIDALETTLNNVPEHHRSMDVVFSHSWRLLTESEQIVLMRLSIFRDDFERDAAIQIANTSLNILTGLIDKSMLHVDNSGRLFFHELLRQFCDAKLQLDQARYEQTLVNLINYYADFLGSFTDNMMGGQQIETVHAIEIELDNIRLAWRYALEQSHCLFFEKAAQTLSLFFQFTSRFAEGAELFGKATKKLATLGNTKAAKALLYLRVDWGWFDIRLGNLNRAEATLSDCLEQYKQKKITPVKGHGSDPRLPLSIIAIVHGNYEQALMFGQEAYEIVEESKHNQNKYFSHYVLANTHYSQGSLPEAEIHANQAYDLAKHHKDMWFTAYCLNVRGNIARASQKYEQAEKYYLESYHIRERFNDPEGMAVALKRLGRIAIIQDEMERALDYYQESLALYQELHDRGGLAEVKDGLAVIAVANEDYEQAQRNFHEALSISHEIDHLTLTLTVIIHVAQLYQELGQSEKSFPLLVLVRDHPASTQQAKAAASRLLGQHRIKTDNSQLPSLNVLVNKLILSLANPESLSFSASNETLVEPLTGRELEVLALLAEGMTNQDIADELTIVVGTVKAHNHSIYGKLGVKNRTEAVIRARELNLI